MKINTTQHRILRYVWKKVKTVRKEISRDLGINPSTVTRNLSDLIDVGIITSYGLVTTSSTVGRKSEVIGINDTWKEIIGISVERGEITTLLTSLTGRVLKKDRKFMEVRSSNLIDVLAKSIEIFEKESQVVSIAVPGIVSDGRVVYSAALGVENMDLKSLVEEKTGKKVFVINDANAVSANFVSESENLVCFLLSIPYSLSEEVGMGAGIWIGGKLHRGSHDAAGETGSGFKLVEGDGTIEDLKGGKISSSDMMKFAKRMGEKISILAQFLDPDLVVLSGDVDLLPKDVRKSFVSEIKKNLISEIDVVVDLKGGESIARGAAMALINEMMNDLNTLKDYIWS